MVNSIAVRSNKKMWKWKRCVTQLMHKAWSKQIHIKNISNFHTHTEPLFNATKSKSHVCHQLNLIAAFRWKLKLSIEVYKFHIQLDYRSENPQIKWKRKWTFSAKKKRATEKNNGILIKREVLTFSLWYSSYLLVCRTPHVFCFRKSIEFLYRNLKQMVFLNP